MSLLSIDESARELGLCQKSVERFIRLGRLSCVRIGRRVLVEREELDAFIAARRQTGKGPVESAGVGGRAGHQVTPPTN